MTPIWNRKTGAKCHVLRRVETASSRPFGKDGPRNVRGYYVVLKANGHQQKVEFGKFHQQYTENPHEIAHLKAVPR